MSLIAEALKKAGSSSLPKSHRPKSSWLLWGGCLTVGIIGVGWLALNFRPKESSRVPEMPAPVLPTAVESAPSSEVTPQETKELSGVQLIMEARSQWRLNGIIRSKDGQALALINERLMEEGQTFQGLRLVRIGPDEVEIEEEGKLSTLTLH